MSYFAIAAWSLPALSVSEPSFYAIQLIAPAATGIAMNESGAVIGTSYVDTGCGSSCLPPNEIVIWQNGVRTVLPAPAGATAYALTGINANGWISGNATSPFTRAVVWKPSGTSYETFDLGVLPNTSISTSAGIDDLNRVVGTSTTPYFPPTPAPFMWTETGGMVNLADQGASIESPLTISRNGTVATPAFWYRLDQPSAVFSLATAPAGYYPPGTQPAVINDNGDQGRFLVTTSTQNLVYPFRYFGAGSWLQLSTTPTGFLTSYGMGGINNDGDVAFTAGGAGMISYGPGGTAISLAGKISPAYANAGVTSAGSVTSDGKILAKVVLGASSRLVRLVPAEPCTVACARVSTLSMTGRMVSNPPGYCTPTAYNRINISATVTNDLGQSVRGATLRGRIMDGYWTNYAVTTRTDSKGVARIGYSGPACVGAVTFVVESVTAKGLTLDTSAGTLASSVIPK
jgi:hypothetical protein